MSRAWQRTLAAAGGSVHEAALDLADGALRGTLDGTAVEAREARRLGPRRVTFRRDGRWVRAYVFRRADLTCVAIGGDVIELREAEQAGAAALADHEEPFATSPMTGTVVKLTAAPGAAVSEGGELLVVEAMKMEYVVRAPRDVVVAEVCVASGESVDFGQVLVTFEDSA